MAPTERYYVAKDGLTIVDRQTGARLALMTEGDVQAVMGFLTLTEDPQ